MPTLPVTDEYGRYASWGPEYYIETENARRNNPFGGLYATDQHTSYFDIMGGFSAGVEIIKGLKFTTSFSGNYTASHGYTHTPVYYTKWNEDGTPDNDYGNNRNSLSESRGQSSNYTWDNVFNFDREFGKHSISATLGHSWMREFYRGMSYNTINDLGAPNIVGVTNVDGKISSNEKIQPSYLSLPVSTMTLTASTFCPQAFDATNHPNSTKTTAPAISLLYPQAGIFTTRSSSKALLYRC